MTLLINLLPWRALGRQRRLRFRLGVTLFVTLLLVCSFWIAWTVLSQKVTTLKTQGNELKEQHHRFQAILDQQRGEQPHERRAGTESPSRVSRWEDILVALASRLPESSWLRTLTWQAGVMTIEGYTADAGDLEKIDTLLAQLPGRFHVKAGPVNHQADRVLSYTFRLEDNGG